MLLHIPIWVPHIQLLSSCFCVLVSSISYVFRDICISASPPSFKLVGSLCFQFTACWSLHTALHSQQIPHDGFIFLFLSIYFFLHITCSLYSFCGDKFFGFYQTIRDSLKDPYPLYKNSDHYAPLVIAASNAAVMYCQILQSIMCHSQLCTMLSALISNISIPSSWINEIISKSFLSFQLFIYSLPMKGFNFMC